MQGIQKLRVERVSLMQCKNLPPRVVSRPFVVEFIRLSHRSPVKHVGARDAVRSRKFMINLGREIVLGGDLLAREGKDSCIPRTQKRSVGWRVKRIYEAQDILIRHDSPGR